MTSSTPIGTGERGTNTRDAMVHPSSIPPLSSACQSVQALAVVCVSLQCSLLSPPRVAYRPPLLSCQPRRARVSARPAPQPHRQSPFDPALPSELCRAGAEDQSGGRRAWPDQRHSGMLLMVSRAA